MVTLDFNYKCIALLAIFISLPAGATELEHPFRRFETLATHFPKAFAGYVNRDFLIPTEAPRWIPDAEGLEFNLEIDACLTNAGRAAGAECERPQIWANVDEHKGELIIYAREIPAQFAPEYAWRILLAEVLLKYPDAHMINISLYFDWKMPDVGQCAERLARGEGPLHAAVDLPSVRVAPNFGFKLTGAEASVRSEDDGFQVPPHFHAALSGNVVLERVNNLH